MKEEEEGRKEKKQDVVTDEEDFKKGQPESRGVVPGVNDSLTEWLIKKK